MELTDAVETRRTVRDFSGRKVPAEVIEKAIRLGLKAPSYNHQKEIFFTLVRSPGLRQELVRAQGMSEEVSETFEAKLQREYEALARQMYMDAIPKQNRMILGAPELLIVVYKPKTQIAAGSAPADLNCLASAWCCIENMLLSFAEDGVFAATMVPDETPRIKSVLGIPQNYEIAAIIPFGYKAPGVKTIPQKDVSVADVLHIDRWD